MPERTILPDCCEDWILEYGSFYQTNAIFRCPECTGEWEKLSSGRFRRTSTGRVFVERARRGEDREFHYLAAEDGDNPLTERCCAKMILRYGKTMRAGDFACPICGTKWRKEESSKGGIRVPCFTRGEGAEPFAIQEGTTRSYLVPLSIHQLAAD